MWIAKVSGVTNYDTALAMDIAEEFAIGLIIDDIKDIRNISKYDARRIFASLENCTGIAEIIPASIDDIFSVIDECRPDMIQINGGYLEDENVLIEMQSIIPSPIIGSLFLDEKTLKPQILDSNPVKAAQILDKYVAAINVNLPLGKSWKYPNKKKEVLELITKIKDSIHNPLIIGGGLDSFNVGKIVRELKPSAVDISTAVERPLGIKDPVLMQEFLQAVYDSKPYISGVKSKL